MKKLICYYIQGEEVSHQTMIGSNTKIDIFIGDLKNFFPTCGKRYHIIYIDSCFNTKEYELLIKECIAPSVCLRGGEGIIFI